MTDERIMAWFALADAGMPQWLLSRIVSEHGGPVQALEADDNALARIDGVTHDTRRRIRESARDRVRHQRQLEVLRSQNMSILEQGDEQWPRRLEDLPDSPPVLFVRGELRTEDALSVALVGPRSATPYGLEVTRRLATSFAPIMTVISGLAVGIDSAAHDFCLKAGGRTIGVAACGLDQDYPSGSTALRKRIATPDGGALISLWPPLTKPRTHHFPIRNNLIAALSLAVVVVEAGERSGSLITARAAGELGRDVFAVPGDITRTNSRGANALITDGAGLCTCAGDVLAALEPVLRNEAPSLASTATEPSSATQPVPGDLGENERLVLEAIRHTSLSLDDLAARFVPETMTSGNLAAALLQLEIRGLARQMPGSIYIPA